MSAIEVAAIQSSVGTKAAIRMGALVTANGRTRSMVPAAAPSHHIHFGSTPLLQTANDSAMRATPRATCPWTSATYWSPCTISALLRSR